jgi:hypothetical protein
MKEITRRSFLGTAAGAAVANTVIGSGPWTPEAVAQAPSKNVGVRVPSDTGALESLESAIFPKPREITATESSFAVDADVRILVPGQASGGDYLLARSLANELGDRFDVHPQIKPASSADSAVRSIVMGSLENPLVQQYCAQMGLTDERIPGPEGYVLQAHKNLVLVAGRDDRGAFWGMQSLRQLLLKQDNKVIVRGAQIRDWPDKQFRGIYLYLPGRDNIPYFKRFVRDYMALYKYNTLIMEMGCSMRLDRHPELNSGWVEFARDCNYSCRNYPPGPFHNLEQNSSHQDTADGGFLEKDEVADLARWVEKHHIELIPEIASFTHSYFLLTKYRELAAVPENKWPDIYCPSKPASYSLVFDVYDEYIDLMQPKLIHIGHDELFLPVGVSSACADEDIGELYGQDVKKVHDHLASRGVKIALWGDMLLESVRGRGLRRHTAPDGFVYSTPGGMTPEQVERLIPKDCLIFNWFWRDDPKRQGGNAKLNEETLDRMGFQQVYGNFEPTITDYQTRKKRTTLLGGAPSAWFATNEMGFGKELMASFLGCSNILWTGQEMEEMKLSARIQSMIPSIRRRLSGATPPSRTESRIEALDISGRFNTGNQIPGMDTYWSPAMTGTVWSGAVPFDLKQVNGKHAIVVGTDGKQPSRLPKAVSGIPVGVAPTSLIFLHAAAKPASNKESFRLMWDQEDTADLLGWYEIVYEDGYLSTIPIRYGLNILEWNWGQHPPSARDQAGYCYGADAVALGEANRGVTFFAFEWINPRLGKVVREIRLNGTTGFRGAPSGFINDWGPVIESNAVVLRAVSIVHKRA